MPEHMLRAFADYGHVRRTLDADPDGAAQTIFSAKSAGIDLAAVTYEPEREGVRSFCDSYDLLLACLKNKLAAVAAVDG